MKIFCVMFIELFIFIDGDLWKILVKLLVWNCLMFLVVIFKLVEVFIIEICLIFCVFFIFVVCVCIVVLDNV